MANISPALLDADTITLPEVDFDASKVGVYADQAGFFQNRFTSRPSSTASRLVRRSIILSVTTASWLGCFLMRYTHRC